MSGSLGEYLVQAIDMVELSEIVPTRDEEEATPMNEDDLESHLNRYLLCASSGDDRPRASSPASMANSLVVSSMGRRQAEYAEIVAADHSSATSMQRWREFIIFLAVLVVSVFEPQRVDSFLCEICSRDNEGRPDPTG